MQMEVQCQLQPCQQWLSLFYPNEHSMSVLLAATMSLEILFSISTCSKNPCPAPSKARQGSRLHSCLLEHWLILIQADECLTMKMSQTLPRATVYSCKSQDIGTRHNRTSTNSVHFGLNLVYHFKSSHRIQIATCIFFSVSKEDVESRRSEPSQPYKYNKEYSTAEYILKRMCVCLYINKAVVEVQTQ